MLCRGSEISVARPIIGLNALASRLDRHPVQDLCSSRMKCVQGQVWHVRHLQRLPLRHGEVVLILRRVVGVQHRARPRSAHRAARRPHRVVPRWPQVLRTGVVCHTTLLDSN